MEWSEIASRSTKGEDLVDVKRRNWWNIGKEGLEKWQQSISRLTQQEEEQSKTIIQFGRTSHSVSLNYASALIYLGIAGQTAICTASLIISPGRGGVSDLTSKSSWSRSDTLLGWMGEASSSGAASGSIQGCSRVAEDAGGCRASRVWWAAWNAAVRTRIWQWNRVF